MRGRNVIDSEGKRWIEFDDDERRYPVTGYIGQVKTGYMCSTDFQHELGEAPSTGPICASVEDLQAAHPCVSECGWVRVLLIAVEQGSAPTPEKPHQESEER